MIIYQYGVMILTYTIYVDVLFLLNFIVDYIIIASTAFISGAAYKKYRILIASAFGAAYSTVVFFPKLEILNIIILKIAVSIIIIFIAFKYINLINHFKNLFVFYIINFIYGGGMYAFYRFTSLGSKMNFSNGEYYINIPLGYIILISIGFYILIKFFGMILDERSVKNSVIKLKITIDGKTTTVNALIDTGNALYDPITMLPVMILEKEKLKSIIDTDNITNTNKILYDEIKKYNMHIIPYKDASGNEHIFYAIKPQEILDITSNRSLREMLIAITDSRLSSDGTYNALLHSKSYLGGN